MSWLWTAWRKPSEASQPAEQAPAKLDQPETSRPNFGLTDEQRTRIFGQFGKKPDENTVSREQAANRELEDFLRSLESPGFAPPAPTTAEDGSPIPQEHDRILPDGSLNIDPMALYPATMSCRQAFDQAFYCQSLGGKFNDIYRFGHLKDCSEQWGAFWFCMRTRTLSSKYKEGMIREYYRTRDERRRRENGGNSEDVWELRTKPLEKAFWKDPYAEEGDSKRVKE